MLVEFPQDELIAKWEEFFEEFGYLSKIISIADRYPEDRSLSVAFDELNRFDTDMAIYLLRHPLNVLMAGEEAIRRLAPPGDEAAQIHLRVKALPRDRRVPIRDLRAKHLGQYIAVEGLVRKSTEVRPRVTDALFQCLRCGTIIKEPQDGQTFREPLECYEEQGGCKRSASATKFRLMTETSMYLDTQKLEIQESPEGLRGGEEPQRLTLYLEDDLTGRITPGERVIMNGVLRSIQKGRPGAKSTLFDILNGLRQPDSGSVLLFGRDVSQAPPWNRAALGLSRTFQSSRVNLDLTVGENLMAGAYLMIPGNVAEAVAGMPRARTGERKAQEAARAVAELLDVAGDWDEFVRNLDFGAQRRVEIGRSLLSGPRLLLLDEPAAGLDASEATALFALIRQLEQDLGLTVLLVEHYVKAVLENCDLIYVLARGRIIAAGSAEEITADPEVRAVYLGEDYQQREEVRADA